MAKADKEFYWRMQGMIYALKIAKEEGVEALERNIRSRNVTQAPFNIDQKGIDKLYTRLSDLLYVNLMSTMLYTLYDDFNFEKDELVKIKKAFAKNTEATMDLDYMGLHYVRLQDYAKELNEKFDLGLDADLIADCEDSYDKKNERTRYCQIDHVLAALEREGYKDAVKYLQDHLEY